MDFIKCAVVRVFGVLWLDGLGWTKPYENWRLDECCDFLGFWPSGSPTKGTSGKGPGKARREGWGGVSGKKATPKFPPREGLQLFAERKTTILLVVEKSSSSELLGKRSRRVTFVD